MGSQTKSGAWCCPRGDTKQAQASHEKRTCPTAQATPRGLEGRHVEMDDREYTISSAILEAARRLTVAHFHFHGAQNQTVIQNGNGMKKSSLRLPSPSRGHENLTLPSQLQAVLRPQSHLLSAPCLPLRPKRRIRALPRMRPVFSLTVHRITAHGSPVLRKPFLKMNSYLTLKLYKNRSYICNPTRNLAPITAPVALRSEWRM
jgi:hypothetical protein